MRIIFFALFVSLSVQANVFTTDTGVTTLDFEGTLIKRGVNSRSAAALIRPNGKQTLRVVLEVKDFLFASDFEYAEFNDEFMESHYFPQIRITGELPPSVDLGRNGSYQAMIDGQITMRQVTRKRTIPVNLTIRADEVVVEFKEKLLLREFNVPYAGPGSDIGNFGVLSFSGVLKKSQR